LVTIYKTTQHHNPEDHNKNHYNIILHTAMYNYVFFSKLPCTKTGISASGMEEQTLQQQLHTSGSVQLWHALPCMKTCINTKLLELVSLSC
jgi:hypothetical protein